MHVSGLELCLCFLRYLLCGLDDYGSGEEACRRSACRALSTAISPKASVAIPFAAGDPSYGGLLRLSAGLLLFAALLTLGGLLGLDALEAGSYWNLGRVGFYTAGVGLLAQALAAVFLLFGSEALE